jgi:hypothetical protein
MLLALLAPTSPFSEKVLVVLVERAQQPMLHAGPAQFTGLGAVSFSMTPMLYLVTVAALAFVL